ncbi:MULTISPECIES: hypothetical protein [Halocynthiibacter]|uniref:Transposase n=1 Tax=Halocynthiibacter halioticoli TaxID=2986804 RepID=A0AAE3IZD9_9RHOB|nr:MULTISPECIES: hypothetical protein [Halocynthiibacter]MCV6825142.1 hypothetical protein [Halocynthiibacter halioticoli]MCW4058143.1 hypothetical protein [Halocynthiibacter sp. SDUM655004]
MFKLSNLFALGAVLVSECKEAVGTGVRFGRMRRPNKSALLLLRAYAMLYQSQKLIRSLDR